MVTPPRDDNDLSFERRFFSGLGKVKNPRAQRRKRKLTVDLEQEPKIAPRKNKKGNAYQHTRTGARSDLEGIVARSSWEADVMRVLKAHKIDFEFEPTTFYFPPDARGKVGAYLPDLYLPDHDIFIEVKGYLDSKGRNKLRKFKKNYPEEFARLWVVISKSNKDNKFFFKKLGVQGILYYEHLCQLYKHKIVNWEGGK